MALQEVRVPDIGEYSNVSVIEITVKVGDTIKEETPLITLETDKATMEIPSSAAGVVKEIAVKVGSKVSKGDLILKVEGAAGASPMGADAPAEKKAAAPVAPAAATSTLTSPPVGEVSARQSRAEGEGVKPSSDAEAIYASPAIRRFAREMGVDLSRVQGSGRKGRITEEDVKQLFKGTGGSSVGAGLNLLADPVVDFAKFGEVDVQPLSRIKKISGANLARNWVKIPHISFFEDADITALEEFRADKKAEAEKAGVKLTPVPFIVKAVAKALAKFPNVNSSLQGDSQVFKKYVHVGVAVDTPNGLMVPVIKNADQKGIYQLARELAEFAAKAKDGKLTAADMQGGCFTISSLGGIGTQYFTPIVNMPEVAILGISKAQMKPVYDGQGFVPRLMLPLSLSVDHRAVDGAEAGRFVVTVAKYLSDLRELIL